jgi:hypothetical protein
MPFDHELQGLSRACGVPSDHGAPSHYLANMGGVGIQALCGDLKRRSGLKRQNDKYWYPVCQILGCENSAQTFFVIDDQDAIRSFGGTELACFRDSNVLGNSKGGRGAECGDGSFLSSMFGWTFLTGGQASCGDGTLASQFGLDFLANGLDGKHDISRYPQARHVRREGR